MLLNLRLEPLTGLFIFTTAHIVIASNIKVRTIWETYISVNTSDFNVGTVNETQHVWEVLEIAIASDMNVGTI